MADASRQQRRRILREQAKIGTRLIATGIAPQPQRGETLAIARVVASKLEEAANPRRAREAAELAHRLCEASLRSHPARLDVACREGCAFCCYQFTAATAPEIFLLTATVRSARNPKLSPDEIIARCGSLIGLTPAERVGRKLPCPLLVDERCSVYTRRPLVCRQATSLDAAACLDEFEGRDLDAQIEVSSIHLAHAGSANVVLLGAIRAAGLADESVELAAGLSLSLRDPDCETRWLAGERVFAGIGATVPRPQNVNHVARQIAAALA